MLPVAALRDSPGNDTLDRLGPRRGFKILSVGSSGTNGWLSFAVMPGRSYRCNMRTSWAARGATCPPAGSPQGYYRVQLLP